MSKNLLDGLNVKTRMIPVEKIMTNLFVRRELNQDHAMYLACLIDDAECPVVLPPILVIPEYECNGSGEISFVAGSDRYMVVYGRHRLWAEDKILDRSEVKCLVILEGIKNETELISLGYRENCGGSLPPTNADTEHTIEMLLERKVPKKNIAEMLWLPPSLARKFINNVQSRLERAKVRRAVNAIVDDSATVIEAAKNQGVAPEKVRAFIAGKKHVDKMDEEAMVRREVSVAYKSLSSKNAGLMRSLFERYDDGDINAKFVLGTIRQIETLQKRGAVSITEWRKRFEAKL